MKLISMIIIFASLQALAAPPLIYEVVKGSCPATPKKKKYVCDNGDGHKEEYIRITTFPEKSSSKVKTRTQTCDRAQLEKLMKLQAEVTELPVEKLKLNSCTAFLQDEKSAKTFLLETGFVRTEEEFAATNGPWKVTLLAKKMNDGMESQIAFESRDSDGGEEIYFDSICDTDGDNKADLILHREDYNGGVELMIFKNLGPKGFATEYKTIEGMPGCGC